MRRGQRLQKLQERQNTHLSVGRHAPGHDVIIDNVMQTRAQLMERATMFKACWFGVAGVRRCCSMRHGRRQEETAGLLVYGCV